MTDIIIMNPSIKVTDCNLLRITNTVHAGGLQTEKEYK
jgi:hypothetical protein